MDLSELDEISPDILGDFAPEEVLHYYNGERAFTTKHNGKTYFAYCIDDDIRDDFVCQYFLVRRVVESEVEQLKNLEVTLRDFLTARTVNAVVKETFKPEYKLQLFLVYTIPDEWIPKQDVYLFKKEKVDGN